MNGKERAMLRKQAQNIQPIVHIGKEGITDNLVIQVKDALKARELVKCTVQQNCELGAREASEILCELTEAEGISAIGRKFVLYKKSEEKIYSL